MRGFITDYLPRKPHDDWECIEDIYCQGGSSPVNGCAWYSPSRHKTLFGGDWIMCPPLPYRATEAQVWAHAREHSIWGKQQQAMARQKKKFEASMDAINAHYKKHGYNTAVVALVFPDGTTKEWEEQIGTRTLLDVLPVLGELVRKKYPPGTRIRKFRVRNSME